MKHDRHIFEAAGMDADPLPERWPRIIGIGTVTLIGLLFWASILWFIFR